VPMLFSNLQQRKPFANRTEAPFSLILSRNMTA
jgi:hypothetical protein